MFKMYFFNNINLFCVRLSAKIKKLYMKHLSEKHEEFRGHILAIKQTNEGVVLRNGIFNILFNY